MQAESLLTTDQNLERINRTVSNLRSQGAARRTHTVTKNKKVRIVSSWFGYVSTARALGASLSIRP